MSIRNLLAAAFLATACTNAIHAAEASELIVPPADPSSAVDDDWYYRPAPPRVEEPSIAQQKAQARAAARMARLDAQRWYGFSPSRPQATGLPFTTMYSPRWQMPGGRPFAWYYGSRPVVIYRSQSYIR